MTLTIKTNNIPRETYQIFQLDEKEQQQVRKQFDYYNEEKLQEQNFFKYKNHWYCLSDFLRLENSDTFKGWEGYSSDSYFSGVLIKIQEGFMGDWNVIVGRYCS